MRHELAESNRERRASTSTIEYPTQEHRPMVDSFESGGVYSRGWELVSRNWL